MSETRVHSIITFAPENGALRTLGTEFLGRVPLHDGRRLLAVGEVAVDVMPA